MQWHCLSFGCSKDDPDPTTAVTGISVDKLSLAQGVNDQEMLIATVSPENASNKNVSWVSSDPTVISVIDGKIIALANGSATVTVATEDGNFTATCAVNVSLLGRVSFRTDRTWEFGSQIWSDAVIATGSKMNGFDGGTYSSSEYKVDCMHNPPYGNWFSWKTVEEYKELLCPNGWRVPMADDFYNLDIALGGDGENHLYLDSSPAPYMEEWGGEYGGYVGDTMENKSLTTRILMPVIGRRQKRMMFRDAA